MTVTEKRIILHGYCGRTDCDRNCELVGKWDHDYCCDPMNNLTCLCIDDASEDELNLGLERIGYEISEMINDTSETTNDPVNHPSHYTKGKIEVADFIADQKLNFDRGNAVKYVCRAGSKDPDKEIQDLEKAIWYINHEIKTLKGDINNGTEKET